MRRDVEVHRSNIAQSESALFDDGNFLQDDYQVAMLARHGQKIRGGFRNESDSSLIRLGDSRKDQRSHGTSTSSTTAGHITDYDEDEIDEDAGLVTSVDSDNEDACINETIGLLSGNRQSSPTDAWTALDVNFGTRSQYCSPSDTLDETDELQSYLTREQLRGVERIRSQMSQAVHVFRELSHLIHNQQDDFDLLDASVYHTKATTSAAVDKLFKANRLKQQARRRRGFMVVLTVVVAMVVLFVYLYRGASPISTPLQAAPVSIQSNSSSATARTALISGLPQEIPPVTAGESLDKEADAVVVGGVTTPSSGLLQHSAEILK